VGALVAAADRAGLIGDDMETSTLLIYGLIAAAAVLCLLVLFGYLPHLRIVPDNTKFDFMQFRRISFPMSAALSILALTLYFTHGLNFGIDFKGGTLLEVQSKVGAIDLAQMRTKLDGLC
jgi:preprotein translocase subunit SecF